MSNFEALLDAIAQRPAMYVGRCSLKSVGDFLDGYDFAFNDHEHGTSPLEGWSRWIESRFLISHAAWHWTSILLHIYGNDRNAIDALPELYKEFLSTRAAIGVAGIEAECQRRFLAEFGKDWHEPPQMSTTTEASHRNPTP